MTRGHLLAQISSQELTAWMALFAVQSEEAKHHQDILESGDGQVHISGSEDGDDEEEDDDGETE